MERMETARDAFVLSKGMWLGFFAGAAIGLLLAPRSGKETRQTISRTVASRRRQVAEKIEGETDDQPEFNAGQP